MSTYNIPFSIKKRSPQNCSQGTFSKGLNKEFKTAVVNKPSVFEPLKVYCNLAMFLADLLLPLNFLLL